jgi:hypothetical protein
VSLRIPFEEAISTPFLFKTQYDELSIPQQTALRVFYGLTLSDPQLEAWAVFNENCLYDEIGQVVAVTKTDYTPKEYEEATLVIGRRGAKTSSFSSFVVAYEALCGGHQKYVRDNQDFALIQVAQDLDTARSNLRQHIIPLLQKSPVGKKELEGDSGKPNVTADTARLRNGALITVAAPTIKIRSKAVAVIAMDEVAFFATATDASNPDVEIERAIRPALAQFPFRKQVKTSTPYGKEGILFRDYQIGTQGSKLPEYKRKNAYSKFLLLHASTAAMKNPALMNEEDPTGELFLRGELEKDPDSFSREYLGKFADSISGFLNQVLLRNAVSASVFERAYDNKNLYIAALDPAFRSDAFAFTIGHYEPKRGFVQDVIRHFKPTEGIPLSPAWVLDQLIPLCSAYGISTAYSDQFQLESLAQLAMDRGLFIERVQFSSKSKADIYGSFQQLLNQKRLHLLDHPEQLQELLKLERHLLAQGGVRISAPSGKHDDLATVAALCAWKAQGLTPHEDDGSSQAAIKSPTNEEAVWAFTSPKKKEQWWD